LFLTRLGPWTILFEKLLSRVVPMLGFLLLSLPLLAFAYTLGGVSLETLGAGVWMLLLAMIQMGTLALACSAWFRSTGGAFIWTYLFSLALFFGPGLCWLIVFSVTGMGVGDLVAHTGGDPFAWLPALLFPFFGPYWCFGFFPTGISSWQLMTHTFLVFAVSAGFLVAARVALVRRAFLPPQDVVLNVFRILDRIFLRLNDNPLTRGFVFIGDTASLPADEPVAWRETAKRSLGKAQYLLRVLIAVEIPVAAFCALVVTAAETADPLGPLLMLVWIVALLMISSQAASLVAGERTRQTLDVLCSTPLTGREIVRQKFQSVRRLMALLLVPFLTVHFFECVMRWRITAQGVPFDLPVYVACALLSLAVYLPLCAWLAFLIGLSAKTHARAIIGSMGAALGWCVVPLVFVILPLTILFPGNGRQDPLFVQFAELLSPVTIVIANEQLFRNEFRDARWAAVVVNFLAYGAALAVIRRLCLKNADRLLGRVELYVASEPFLNWPARRPGPNRQLVSSDL
jgi:hypothetical protein